MTGLVERNPQVGRNQLISDLVPPTHFGAVTFDGYVPDPAEPSQSAALQALRDFAAQTPGSAARRGWSRLLGGSSRGGGSSGVYLDGGFGVGKTHLLAALWHEAPAPKAFGTFVEYTNLVGALGFRPAVEALATNRLVCVDEFELDDPGDTVLMARLLRELVEAGVRLAATSNTLPDAQGEGRFAAEEFLREIQSVASHFDVLRVDGQDYRHRGLGDPPEPVDEARLTHLAGSGPGAVLDDFDALLAHLATVHPSRYRALLEGVQTVLWRGVHQLDDQSIALRLVVLVDRMYDQDVTLAATGSRLDEVFGAEMLEGGYRKKYRRALSRLTAMAARQP